MLRCFYIVPVRQVPENSEYGSLLVGEGGNPINMAIGQMGLQASKVIGLDPTKRQNQISIAARACVLQHLVLMVVENSQCRTFEVGDKGASPYGYCSDMPT